MYNKTTSISTVGMSREEWLGHRRKGIGGSDAAAIVCMNPYESPYSVWASKLGLLPEKEDTEAMRQGRDFENYVATRFTEKTGKKVRRRNEIITSCKHPFMFANIDRAIVGERAGLECKTSKDIHLSHFQNGDYPDTYYCQCLHYLAVTGFDRWYLAVLVYGTDLLNFTIERKEHEEDIQTLIRAEKAFWEGHVLPRVPPAPDGHTATTSALSTLHPVSDGSYIQCEDPEALLQYSGVHARLAALTEEKAVYSNRIKDMLGDAEGFMTDTHVAKWSNRKRTKFNEAAFMQAHPSIDLAPYFESKTYRVLTVTEKEMV